MASQNDLVKYSMAIILWLGLFFFFSWVFQQLYNKSIPKMNHTFNKIDYMTAVNFMGMIIIFGFFTTRIYIMQHV